MIGFLPGESDVLIQDAGGIRRLSAADGFKSDEPIHKALPPRSIVDARLSSTGWLVISAKQDNSEAMRTTVQQVGPSRSRDSSWLSLPLRKYFFLNTGHYLCASFSKIQRPWDWNKPRYWHLSDQTRSTPYEFSSSRAEVAQKAQSDRTIRLVARSNDNRWVLTEEEKHLYLWDLAKSDKDVDSAGNPG